MSYTNPTPAWKKSLEESQQKLRDQYPDHVWECDGENCRCILGKASLDYRIMYIKARDVHIQVEGGTVRRQCTLCQKQNELRPERRNGIMVYSITKKPISA